jgi:hypothetical protein
VLLCRLVRERQKQAIAANASRQQLMAAEYFMCLLLPILTDRPLPPRSADDPLLLNWDKIGPVNSGHGDADIWKEGDR